MSTDPGHPLHIQHPPRWDLTRCHPLLDSLRRYANELSKLRLAARSVDDLSDGVGHAWDYTSVTLILTSKIKVILASGLTSSTCRLAAWK